MTSSEAAEAVRNGETVKYVVGEDPEDPTLHVALEWESCELMVVSHGVSGWSQGISEPVCDFMSDFLEEFFEGAHSLEVISR